MKPHDFFFALVSALLALLSAIVVNLIAYTTLGIDGLWFRTIVQFAVILMWSEIGYQHFKPEQALWLRVGKTRLTKMLGALAIGCSFTFIGLPLWLGIKNPAVLMLFMGLAVAPTLALQKLASAQDRACSNQSNGSVA